MARLLRVPSIAAGMVSALLESWAVAEQTAFSAADVIATLETDKALVDVEAESDGVILKVLVPAGTEVEVGAPIAILGDHGEKVGDLDALLTSLGVTASAPITGADAAPASAALALATAGPAAPLGGRIFASPIARRLAREAGILVEHLVGTGPGGRIVRRDVDAAIARQPALSNTATSSSPAVSAEQRLQSYTDTPHTRMRRAIASRLTQSQATPHFYVRATCRVDRLLKARAELNEASPTKISINDMVIKAAARAHVLVPAMNAIWMDDAIRSYASVDMSVAIATETGLVAPILRGVEQLSISQVAARVQDLVARARSGTLRQNELEGGALGLTNLGMFGTEEFAAIINPPQSAILAVGAAHDAVVAVDGAAAVATVLKVVLSVDHRVIDGAIAAVWMRTFTSLVEHPVQIFA